MFIILIMSLLSNVITQISFNSDKTTVHLSHFIFLNYKDLPSLNSKQINSLFRKNYD